MSSTSQSDGGGGRRKKVSDYLRAANEWRQTYTTQIGNTIRELSSDDYDIPGSYPDAAEAARAGEGEVVLFPTYAKKVYSEGAVSASTRSRRSPDDSESEAETVKTDRWRDDKDSHAIVDIDVHGWLYLPQRGAMGRKNRLMMALVRKLSGIPAPPAGDDTIEAQEKTSGGSGEDEAINHQAQLIVNEASRRRQQQLSADSNDDLRFSRKPSVSLSPTPSWGSTVHMTKDELADANQTLVTRMHPFLAQPIPDIPISVFFYSDQQSQLRNVYTDESGHFFVRTGLRFVPTNIRVLAFESLSVTSEVHVVEPTGVSLISDIDDTVKRSCILLGAKEVCRNTFVRDMSELTVDGTEQWYGKLASMGVQFHYVSNSPWQLFPVLKQFFKVAKLPHGSVHLKQYGGMLQGLFESAAERKRSSLEKILGDFPHRKFVLVGDSGEGDLEVYTELALSYPGRILAIFIRDVTTAEQKRFFDKSVDHLAETRDWARSTGHVDTYEGERKEEQAREKKPPALPPRRQTSSPARTIDNGDLIDLSDESPPLLSPLPEKPKEETKGDKATRPAVPPKPFKPSSLRNVVGTNEGHSVADEREKGVPPLPRRGLDDTARGGPLSGKPNSETSMTKLSPPPAPPPRRSKTTPTRAELESAFLRPAPSPPPPPPRQSAPVAAASSALQFASDKLNLGSSSSPPASNQDQPRALARTGTGMSMLGMWNKGDEGTPGTQEQGTNVKREEAWRRRWEQAKDVLDEQGVLLGMWRVGSDVEGVCEWVVREAMDEDKTKARK